jgi:hypothetical protein
MTLLNQATLNPAGLKQAAVHLPGPAGSKTPDIFFEQ